MSTPPPSDPRPPANRRRRVPVTTWIGIGAAVAVLVTSATAYGATHPTSPTASDHTVAASASPRTATAVAAPQTTRTPSPALTQTPTPSQTPSPTPTPTPVVTTRLVTATTAIPFKTATVGSATLAKGASSVTTAGVNGVETKTYAVTYTNGVQTSRVLKNDVVTKQPVTQVTTVGTYVAPAAPACTNGSYVNSAGNTVCSPERSSTVPSGATAKCVDGTYSFSQSRRGTCSSHGGVAVWL